MIDGKDRFPKALGKVELIVWSPLKQRKLWLPNWVRNRMPFNPDKYQCRGHRILGMNVVVNNAVKQMARLLGGYQQSDRYINRMQFGAGSTNPASATDTVLESPLSPIKSITDVSYPNDSSVKFKAYLLEDELNGFPIQEAGLLFVNTSPALAARKTFSSLTKTNEFVFEWNWTIYWNISS